MPDPSTDLTRREERLSCSSGNSWGLGAQKVVQLLHVSQSLLGRTVRPFPAALYCPCCGPENHQDSRARLLCSNGAQLSMVIYGSAWEGSCQLWRHPERCGVWEAELPPVHLSISVGSGEPGRAGPWCETGRTQGTWGQVDAKWVKVAARGL